MLRLLLRRSLLTLQKVPATRFPTTFNSSITRSCSQQTHRLELGKIDDQHKKFQLSYTCKKCNHKNSHIISKLAYEKGVVIVKCSGCENNHLIADNLKWFKDTNTNIEDILKEKGEEVRRFDGSEILELLKKEEDNKS